MTQLKNTINWIAIFKANPPKVGASYKIETEYSSLCASRLNQIGWSARREHHGDGWSTVHVIEKTRPILMKDSLLAKLRTIGTPKQRAIVAACERWVNQPCTVKTEANKALMGWKETRK